MFVDRRKKNRIVIVLLGLILTLLFVPQNVYAIDAIEVGEHVSLKIEYKLSDGTKISGAAFDIYKVAEVSENMEFVKTSEFKAFSGSIDNSDQAGWDESAKDAVDFIKSNEAIRPFASGKTDKDGEILFPEEGIEMTTGLYLVVGHECEYNGKTYSCSPFFICLPDLDVDEQWRYEEVKAEPKPDWNSKPDVEKDTPVSKLPQTGMLLWPIPVLAGTGLLFFMIGWAKRRKEDL